MSGICSSAARLHCTFSHLIMSTPHTVFQRLGVPGGQHVDSGGAPPDQVPGTRTSNESFAWDHGTLLIIRARRTAMQMVPAGEKSLCRR